ncbi:MAG: GNAT family N-acetyltransferase [Myxococcota bacterium]|nr:GNAT family N-acetyltransferase [Myxococcota bacterium]
MDPVLAFRSITAADEAFLCDLYASTREAELEPLDWSEAQKRSFLRQQFAAQHAFYTEQFQRAVFEIVQLDGEPVGRLYVDRRPDEIRLIDIALVPAQRGRGLGTRLLRELLAEGERVGKPVRIHVEHFNPALRLYRRLGFEPIGDEGVYLLMQWSPAAAAREER